MYKDSTFENNQFAHGYAIDATYDSIPEVFPLHWHRYIEIIYAKEDGICYQINGTDYHLKTGDILLVWPGELHSIGGGIPGPKKVIMIQLESSLIEDRINFQSFAHLFYNTHHLTPENCPNVLMLSVFLMNVKESSLHQSLFPEFYSCIHIYYFFMELGKILVDASTPEPERFIYRKRDDTHLQLQKACGYISTHCIENISLEDVAKMTGFSKCHFSKIFHKHTGLPFTDFLTRARLRISQQLLRNPNLTVTEVSLSSGFNSISTFNRVFHEFTNVSPTEFRKMYLES